MIKIKKQKLKMENIHVYFLGVRLKLLFPCWEQQLFRKTSTTPIKQSIW